ncbi:MAG: carbohydrate binding family 9 domain-containing protein [Flavobacteriaceae bacterium]|nr:carbohydrate binding family 9 domain-containing protein [Flavobacteriaceae bacterium]
MYKHSSTILLCIFFIKLNAQQVNRQFTVKLINETITLDGDLNEPVWEFAEAAKNYWQFFPSDSIRAIQQSTVKMMYDNKNLYIGVRVNAAGNDYIVQSLKRDYRAGGNDNITFLFDTFNDGTNAYYFGTNPLGVIREGLITGGGQDFKNFIGSWDTKWRSESKIQDGFWSAELIIPLSAFKYKAGTKKWRFNSYTFDTQTNERSTWINIPRNQNIISLAFMGDMIFEEPLPRAKMPISLIPYTNGLISHDFETNDTERKLSVGGDAKIAIGNSMNLDLTVNPDFSQVEVDDQIVNLSRFEVGLPEKRQFFIDNSDLFGGFGGSRDANPFFSRRIGIAKDQDDNTIENRILAGARLSGKLNEDWRLGFLNIATDEDTANEIAMNNNMVFALQRKVFSRSSLSVFAIDRRNLKNYDFIEENEKRNSVIGFDYLLASEDNAWNGKFYVHKSFTPEAEDKDYSAGAFLSYNKTNWTGLVDLVYIGEDFQSDLGFIRRTDILKGSAMTEYSWWPKKGSINRQSIQYFGFFTWRPGVDMLYADHDMGLEYSMEFKNQARLGAEIDHKYVYLTDSFNPARTDDGLDLPEGSEYKYSKVTAFYGSDRRKTFSYNLRAAAGKFFNGNILNINTNMQFRIQPKIFLSMRASYNKISLPEPYDTNEIWLIGPKIDVTFNKKLFWSTFVQYSNLSDNLGINSRLQWRFAPLSDLYLVYNDNYFVNDFMPKTRSINLKLTYWLNI